MFCFVLGGRAGGRRCWRFYSSAPAVFLPRSFHRFPPRCAGERGSCLLRWSGICFCRGSCNKFLLGPGGTYGTTYPFEQYAGWVDRFILFSFYTLSRKNAVGATTPPAASTPPDRNNTSPPPPHFVLHRIPTGRSASCRYGRRSTRTLPAQRCRLLSAGRAAARRAAEEGGS